MQQISQTVAQLVNQPLNPLAKSLKNLDNQAVSKVISQSGNQ